MSSRNSSKWEDLQDLRKISAFTPLTFWSLEDFSRSAPRALSWRIRSTDGSGISRAAVDFNAVGAILSSARQGDYVIQEMLAPLVAGATAVLGSRRSLSECVHGDAQSLLRDGQDGFRMLVRAGEVEWIGNLGDEHFDIGSLLGQIARIEADCEDVILEWIFDSKNRFYWVDMKHTCPGFLASVPDRATGLARSVGSRRSGASIRLPRPDLGAVELLSTVENLHRVTFSAGSPLAHACFRLHTEGVTVEVKLTSA